MAADAGVTYKDASRALSHTYGPWVVVIEHKGRKDNNDNQAAFIDWHRMTTEASPHGAEASPHGAEAILSLFTSLCCVLVPAGNGQIPLGTIILMISTFLPPRAAKLKREDPLDQSILSDA